MLRYAAFAHPPAVAVQSALIRDCLPGFAAENRLTVVDEEVLPRIWLGNAITTPTHLDEWNNIGCVVAGRRRFTLFPPEQIANLYIGPLDFAPTGAPMSLVSLHEPDFERFPRFRDALAAAVTRRAESRGCDLHPAAVVASRRVARAIQPADELLVARHHGRSGRGAIPGSTASIHAILNLRPLPAATRGAWRALFEHYVFGPQEGVVAHIPELRHGLLGSLSATEAARRRNQLAQRLAEHGGHGDEA